LLHQVRDLFELNVKLRCQKVKSKVKSKALPFANEEVTEADQRHPDAARVACI
jgi:hypothetical protein